MPVPTELRSFFTNLVEKSKRSEINWEANGGPDAYQVRFADFAIGIRQDETKPSVPRDVRSPKSSRCLPVGPIISSQGSAFF